MDINESVKEYFKSLNGVKPLKRKEERNLLFEYHINKNIDARNKFISNLKYTCSLANTYRGKGVDFEDLLSEANDGLIEAIEKYDLTQNVKLITYAKWWIIQRLNACIANNNKFLYDDIPIDNSKEVSDDEEIVDSHFNSFQVDSNENNIKKDNKILVNNLLKVLTERERDIIISYYGIYGGKENLEKIGLRYNLTKERIRQIIEYSFKKLRTEALRTNF